MENKKKKTQKLVISIFDQKESEEVQKKRILEDFFQHSVDNSGDFKVI